MKYLKHYKERTEKIWREHIEPIIQIPLKSQLPDPDKAAAELKPRCQNQGSTSADLFSSSHHASAFPVGKSRKIRSEPISHGTVLLMHLGSRKWHIQQRKSKKADDF